MCCRGRKVQGQNAEKKEKAARNEHFCLLFFLTLPLNSSWLVSGSQVYSSRTLLGSDAALCICSGEDRTAAAINYSAGTPMPQSLLGILPVCYQHFLPSCFSHIHSCAKSRHKWARIDSFFTYLQVSIFTSDGEERAQPML